jgi:hypothetical protein
MRRRSRKIPRMPIVTISQQEFSQAKVCELSLFIQNILINLSVLIRGIWGECLSRHGGAVILGMFRLRAATVRGSPLNMTGLSTIDGSKREERGRAVQNSFINMVRQALALAELMRRRAVNSTRQIRNSHKSLARIPGEQCLGGFHRKAALSAKANMASVMQQYDLALCGPVQLFRDFVDDVLS